tara:strand:- start:713 stop:1060 length:348 start_codon:yes stop_codon:yes gene_type:complete
MGNKFVKDMDSVNHWMSSCHWPKSWGMCKPENVERTLNNMGQTFQQNNMRNTQTGEAFAQETPDFFNTMNSMLQHQTRPSLVIPKGYRSGGVPPDRSTFDTALSNRLGHISGFHY